MIPLAIIAVAFIFTGQRRNTNVSPSHINGAFPVPDQRG